MEKFSTSRESILETVHDEKLEKNGTRRYTLKSGETIEVNWKEFDPGKETCTDTSVVFLPGWAIGEQTEMVKNLSEAFSKNSKSPTYAVTSRAEQLRPSEDSLKNQAEAIKEFIKERGIKELILAGHSQGGDKAINVAAMLQEDPSMKIKGVILLDSMGLYEQSPMGLAGHLAKDLIVDTPIGMTGFDMKNPAMRKWVRENTAMARKSIRSAIDIIIAIMKDVQKSRLDYPAKLIKEVREMAKANPNLGKLKMPIILMSGSQDPISNPEKMIAYNKEEGRPEESAGPIDSREYYLRKNIFPESPYVKMVVPEKFGHHSMPFFRAESVAKTSLYLLKRFENISKTKTEGN
ncbi:alpha/beta hydrolase [Candidatus Jorgensenbacteria bacterium]|nr:alpha/beta hydrolase [Candidatus Jorgensenbacteria bacterium]